jgi:hypothetical protein
MISERSDEQVRECRERNPSCIELCLDKAHCEEVARKQIPESIQKLIDEIVDAKPISSAWSASSYLKKPFNRLELEKVYYEKVDICKKDPSIKEMSEQEQITYLLSWMKMEWESCKYLKENLRLL